MQGRAVVTNTDGIADFRDMYFEQAHPGGEYWRGLAHSSCSCVCCSPVRNSHSSAASLPRFTRAAYTISFQCEPPSACNNFHDEVQVTVRSDVKELVLGDGFESPLPEQTIALDTRFDSIKTVRVVNLNGTAAVGKRVRVFSYGNVQMIPLAVPDSVVIPGLTHIENDMMQALDVNKLATFDGGSALTDEEGIARFPNLTISGYAGPSPYVIMGFYCEGQVVSSMLTLPAERPVAGKFL